MNNANEFYTSTYPVISSGNKSKVIKTSTANGIGNMYYKLWEGAVQGANDYKPFKVDWWDVPGRDEEWKAQTISNTSEAQFKQEFGNCLESNSETVIRINNTNEVYKIKIGCLHACLTGEGASDISVEERIRQSSICRVDS